MELESDIKVEIIKFILLVDSNTRKIGEISKGVDIEKLKEFSLEIYNMIYVKYPTLFPSLPKLSTEKFNLIETLRFVRAAIPLLVKQRHVDSLAIAVSYKINELKNLIISAEDMLKDFKLNGCGDCINKIDKIILDLKENFKPIYNEINQLKEIENKIINYKQHVQDVAIVTVHQIILFSSKEGIINEGKLFYK